MPRFSQEFSRLLKAGWKRVAAEMGRSGLAGSPALVIMSVLSGWHRCVGYSLKVRAVSSISKCYRSANRQKISYVLFGSDAFRDLEKHFGSRLGTTHIMFDHDSGHDATQMIALFN